MASAFNQRIAHPMILVCYG